MGRSFLEQPFKGGVNGGCSGPLSSGTLIQCLRSCHGKDEVVVLHPSFMTWVLYESVLNHRNYIGACSPHKNCITQSPSGLLHLDCSVACWLALCSCSLLQPRVCLRDSLSLLAALFSLMKFNRTRLPQKIILSEESWLLDFFSLSGDNSSSL